MRQTEAAVKERTKASSILVARERSEVMVMVMVMRMRAKAGIVLTEVKMN